jgi:hypothetical protein
MKAALLPDRGVVKVAGDDARNFLHGLLSADILKLDAGRSALRRAVVAAGQDPRGFHRRRSPGAGGRRLSSSTRSRALANPLVDEAQRLQAAFPRDR